MEATDLGHVAVNMRVVRCAPGLHAATMERIWGSKPMSSMRSASSSTRYTTALAVMGGVRPCGGSRKSFSRPGVATTRSHPPRMARSWPPLSVPP